MNTAHAPRPADLVALVSFDGEVYENQAVTRERLGGPNEMPHALATAIEQWLGRGRHMWIDVRGRQIHGIATARDLATPEAWEIDTLVAAGPAGADDPAGNEDEVVIGLLRQATEAAAQAGVQRVLLRLAADAPALNGAMRSGFTLAVREALWAGQPSLASAPAATVRVRLTEDADAFALFQLYNRALPMDGRRALAATFEEWQAVQERRWLARGRQEFVAERDGRVTAALALGAGGRCSQLSLLAEPGADADAGALLTEAARHLGSEQVLALIAGGGFAPLLEACGLACVEEYVLLVQRTTRPLVEALPTAAGQVVPSRG